jgi:N-hydroxyarylamine O-acetyltransferase
MSHMLIADPAAFDLDAYFARIGYAGPRRASGDVLRELHMRHAQAIPFENLNPLLGWPVRLDTASLVSKLVHDRRGGYCFEQNLLFAHALHALGFTCRGLAARVVYNAHGGTIPPRSHMLLAISLSSDTLLADVGFGGLTLTGPLVLQPGLEQATPHEPFRVMSADDEAYDMDARIGDSWMTLYRFTLETAYLADYEMTSWYLCHAPGSRFTSSLMAARPIDGGRYALRNNVLTRHSRSTGSERRVLSNGAALRGTLEHELGLQLPDSPELDTALDRVAAATEPV